MPPSAPEAAATSARRRSCRRSCAGSDALRLEVEQLAALVAALRDDAEQQPEQREHKSRQRGCLQHRHRRAGDRLGAQRALQAGARGDGERRERGLRETGGGCSACRTRAAQPELGREAGAGRRRVQRGLEGGAVGDDEVGGLARGASPGSAARPRRRGRSGSGRRRHPEQAGRGPASWAIRGETTAGMRRPSVGWRGRR